MDRLRILVVDDLPDAADSLAFLLGVVGHDAQAAYSGRSAVDKADVIAFDVVLLDIGMPGLDGYSVAMRIRKNTASKDSLLIAITGYADSAHRMLSEEAGFDDYLVKPVDPIELIARLSKPDAVRQWANAA
jgi:DNA-binding response OmpR family regulator